MVDLIIGVDGGGSRTRTCLANVRGEVLGTGEGGASNPQSGGVQTAQREILVAIRGAFAAARLEPRVVAAACLGIGGVERAEERAAFVRWAGETIAPRVEVLNDAEIVLAAGAPEDWGIALIAGTGAMAWGRARDGRMARASGWGYLIGDEGSAFDLARQALRAATHAADGRGAATQLLPAILHAWGLREPLELIPRVYRSGLGCADIARLAPVVVQVAAEGDPIAGELIEQAGAALASAVIAVARTLRIERAAIPLALTGGLLLETDSVRVQLLEALERRGCNASPITLVPEPVRGAVRRARAMLAGQ